MIEMKYIIVDKLYPIIFPLHFNHSDMAKNYNVTSAGFIDNDGKVYGYSDSLNLSYNPSDQKLIEYFIQPKGK